MQDGGRPKRTRVVIVEDRKEKELVADGERDITNQVDLVSWVHLKDPWAKARLLYPNPVCFLTTLGPIKTGGDDSTARFHRHQLDYTEGGGDHKPRNRSRNGLTDSSGSAITTAREDRGVVLSLAYGPSNGRNDNNADEGQSRGDDHNSRKDNVNTERDDPVVPPVSSSSTTTSESQGLNAMVITWLTCADNNGGIIASVNRRRHSALALQRPDSRFTLSVPTVGMEDLVVSVGSCSGRNVDKFQVLNLRSQQLPIKVCGDKAVPCVDHASIVAVMDCTVVRIGDAVEKDHMTVFARIVHAFVKKSHWDGKCFHGDPPILSFLGSKRFATCNALMDNDDEQMKE